MLGEAARTQKDADVYFERYLAAIDAVGQAAGPFSTMHADALYTRPGLSVKLSALHPRFEPGKEERLAAELAPRMLTLARAARSRGLTLTIDAEEQDRLDLTLEIFGATFTNPALDSWSGLGIAVQAYGKRAMPVLRWLRRLAERTRQAHSRAPRQGRLLGQRDQVGAGARAQRLSRVHAQAAHGRVVPRLRAADC